MGLAWGPVDGHGNEGRAMDRDKWEEEGMRSSGCDGRQRTFASPGAGAKGKTGYVVYE